MTNVICNTSPFQYLHQIDQLCILPALAGKIIVPSAVVVEGFRWALLGSGDVGGLLWVSTGIVILLLAGGLVYFKRMEDTFADVI